MSRKRGEGVYRYLITFHSTHTALRAEDVLKKEGIAFRLLPTPGNIKAGCGLSIGFNDEVKDNLVRTLERRGIRYRGYINTEGGYKKIDLVL